MAFKGHKDARSPSTKRFDCFVFVFSVLVFYQNQILMLNYGAASSHSVSLTFFVTFCMFSQISAVLADHLSSNNMEAVCQNLKFLHIFDLVCVSSFLQRSLTGSANCRFLMLYVALIGEMFQDPLKRSFPPHLAKHGGFCMHCAKPYSSVKDISADIP